MNKLPKIYISPVNQTIYEAIEEYMSYSGENIGYLLSQRQHNNDDGGYVPKNIINKLIKSDRFLLRDHFCLKKDEDIHKKIAYDAVRFNLVHIDPWFYGEYDKYAVKQWIEVFINYNPRIKFEIGTEDFIAKLSIEDYQGLLDTIKDYYSYITYLVCQGGSVVFDLQNISPIDYQQTSKFVSLAEKNGFKTKRHNCDFHSLKDIKELRAIGVNAFNYAPEISGVYNEELLNLLSKDEINILKPILIQTAPWHRWIYAHDCENTERLFKSCLHYIQHEILDEKLHICKEAIKKKIGRKLQYLSDAI